MRPTHPILFAFLSLFLPAAALQAAPSVAVNDTGTPIQVDGDLSDWTAPPDIVLDQASQVVIGKEKWSGPEAASAKIRITYDAKNFYISADILSKTPQYNSQEGSNIYNGDALELYVGADNSDPGRKSYGPADVQIFISPGKNGENSQVYSATDKGKIPGAKLGSKLTSKGYTLEVSIPLEYFYKLDVGPGKKMAFDVALNDCGPMSKNRTLQLSWSGSSMGWQDPSVWGTLEFKGKTVFVNTKPKQAMPGAVLTELDPSAGKKNASKRGILLWGFNEGGLGGFAGKLSIDTSLSSEGTGSLKVDADGSSGWNQNLCKAKPVAQPEKWKELKSITMDVFFPPGSIAKTSYTEVFLITSGSVNTWYQAMKVKMREGWNHLEQEVDAHQFDGIQEAYLVFNSGGPISGPVYIDNIRGILKGAPAVFKGKVASKSGDPVGGAILAVNRKQVVTAADGTFKIDLPEDKYTLEVFAAGYQPLKAEIEVAAADPKPWKGVLEPEATVPKDALVDVFFDQKVRSLDLHYLIGNNIADWHMPAWFSDPVAIAKAKEVYTYIRVPGGGHSNIWRWRTGQVLRKDGTVQEVQNSQWKDMVKFIKSIPGSEVIMTANIMTEDVQNTLDWIADAKAQGLKVRYVELGNEPDYEADLLYKGQSQYWSVIDNYSKHFIEFARAIKSAYPEIKIMGPTCAQVDNRQRKEGSPWLASEDSPWWVERFLQNCGPYVDVVAVHSYPYWSNDSDSNLLSKTSLWSEWVPKIRASIRKNIPDRADEVEISLSEWNSGDENAATARLVNGIFAADYLAQMMLWGVNQTNIWDMFTQKPGLGGGHGVFDPAGDPDRPYAERAHHWALLMMRKYFGDTLYQAVTDQEELSAYASSGNGKKFLMVVNKHSRNAYRTTVNLGDSAPGKYRLDLHRLSSKEYQWSENLYRAVINKGPLSLKGSQPVESRFQHTFPPFSITCIEMTPVR